MPIDFVRPQQNKAANEIVQTLTGRSRWRANAKFETSEASGSAVVIFQYTLVYSYINLVYTYIFLLSLGKDHCD